MTAAEIARRLQAALPGTEVQVRDDSAQHAGHAGAREGGHFHVVLRGECFAGRTRLARHRLVYDALGPLQSAGIHALSIDARTPQEP
jgi:BolA protein